MIERITKPTVMCTYILWHFLKVFLSNGLIISKCVAPVDAIVVSTGRSQDVS